LAQYEFIADDNGDDDGGDDAETCQVTRLADYVLQMLITAQ